MLEKQLMLPETELALFNENNQKQLDQPAKQQHSLQPFLVAYACSIITLIMSASTGLHVEVDDKVAQLPAMERDEHVGNARLALIGITDLHRQLSRGCTSSAQRGNKPHPRAGSNMQDRSGAQAANKDSTIRNNLDVACKALVKAADRLVMHAHYMYGSSLYIHKRSVAALLQPEGPLCKGEGEALDNLLGFFQRLPHALFQDDIHKFTGNPTNVVRGLVQRISKLESHCTLYMVAARLGCW